MAQPNLWGGVLDGLQNPLTMGGLSLLTGGDLNSGIQAGTALQKQMQQKRQQEALQQGLMGMPNMTDNDRQILGASPDLASDVLSNIYKSRFDPMAGLDADYKRAQIGKLKAEAAGGGETPANVREWQAFQKMAPEDQQRYLTMKRADRFYNTGTGFTQPNQLDPAGAPRAILPIDNAGKASATEFGKKRGDVAFNLPQFEYNAKKLVASLDGVLSDPYLPNMVGPVNGNLPNISGAANRVQSKMEQIQAKSFLQAYDDMRGAGAISDAEGAKAERSKNRLQNAKQGTQDWIDAANEFRQDVLDLVALKRQQANGTYQPPQAAPQGPPSDNAPAGIPRSMIGPGRSAAAPPAAAAPANNGWSIKRVD